MKPQNPCYKCAERVADCHAKCETYAEFSKAQEKYREQTHYGRNKDWGSQIAEPQNRTQ